MRVYDDCSHSEGFMPCLKKKAILFFDRAARMEVIPLVSGVDVVRTTPSEVPALSENDIDAVLPRNLDKNQALTQMLWDRVASFANSRTVQLSLPKMSGQDLNKGVEEGIYHFFVISLSSFLLQPTAGRRPRLLHATLIDIGFLAFSKIKNQNYI